jgi:uroporphyrinogen-III synthase
MDPTTTKVLCLKAPTGDYAEVFKGLNISFLQVLAKRGLISEGSSLSETLSTASGLIVTSAAAFESLSNVTDEDILEKPLFVVGKATERVAKDVGFRRVLGSESGSASALANVILSFFENADALETIDASHPLLFLAGRRRSNAIPEILGAAGIPLTELTVYETAPIPGVLDALTEMLSDMLSHPDSSTEVSSDISTHTNWIVFFSPSGFKIVKPVLDAFKGRGSLLLASIGPSTTEAIQSGGYTVSAQASDPSPESLLSAILSYTPSPSHT